MKIIRIEGCYDCPYSAYVSWGTLFFCNKFQRYIYEYYKVNTENNINHLESDKMHPCGKKYPDWCELEEQTMNIKERESENRPKNEDVIRGIPPKKVVNRCPKCGFITYYYGLCLWCINGVERE